ncbi:MAG: CusA/CzcA family heavy metal efflux RND transporter [Cyanobacteriota bacterium]
MIDKIIEYSAKNRFIILLITFFLVLWGVWALYKIPIDAIPDLSDNQVIVYTDWEGRSPQIIEDQITYPLSSNLQGLPNVKDVRASSAFGFSMIYVIFDDNVDIYWARSRVLEKLTSIKNLLPENVTPTLGPDGTGVGQVYWYTVKGKGYDLAQLRSIQDWYIKYQLNSVSGVAEVPSIGGFIKQYQIDIDPNKIYSYKIPLKKVIEAIKTSNKDVGGKIIESNDREYMIRGLGYIKSIKDIENILIDYSPNRVPIYVRDIATVQMGGDLRRGLLDENGKGEVVGGIIVMRQGENAQKVINDVKEKIKEISKGLPKGVTIETAYDRSELIKGAVNTLNNSLTEEGVVVSIVILMFLGHVRSSFLIITTMPVAILISFIFMYYFKVTANIMSLGGIIIAVGDLADSAIVMVENAYRNLSNNDEGKPYFEIIVDSAKQVGKPLFFSILIIIISFSPVFLLEGQEGKLFAPLAFTKTFGMIGALFLTVTFVPVMMTIFLKGKFKPEDENPVSKFFIFFYRPILNICLRFKKISIILALLSMILTIPIAKRIGSEFMPPLDEGSLLFMPTTLPDINITEAKRIIQIQDKIISNYPEVKYVLGKVGRAETPTDPSPLNMSETIIMLKQQNEWRKGLTKNDIISELNQQLQIPGVSNAWTQPIINRINMLATGVRTDLGLKIYGKDLKLLGELSSHAESIIKNIRGATDLYSERTVSGKYIDISIDREKSSQYGASLEDIQEVIETAIGGMNISYTVEGRERFPIRVRYQKDYRDNLQSLDKVFVDTMQGKIPLLQLTKIKISEGASMINSEKGLLRNLVYLNVRDRDIGTFVKEANEVLTKNLKMPPGYYFSWSGQYENQIRAKNRLQIVIPIVLLINIIVLYFTFNSLRDTFIVVLSVPFALIGGIILMYFLNYNFSVAVAVGFIALVGIATETGVIMLSYLNDALDEKKKLIKKISIIDLNEAVMNGAVLRLRPKLMTALINLIGLIPVMVSTGTGSDVMKPLATPLIGGIISSTVLVLIIIPVIFFMVHEYDIGKEI